MKRRRSPVYKVYRLEDRIGMWKSYMRRRELSHDLYYTDPYGRTMDLAFLNDLKRQLKEARLENNIR